MSAGVTYQFDCVKLCLTASPTETAFQPWRVTDMGAAAHMVAMSHVAPAHIVLSNGISNAAQHG